MCFKEPIVLTLEAQARHTQYSNMNEHTHTEYICIHSSFHRVETGISSQFEGVCCLVARVFALSDHLSSCDSAFLLCYSLLQSLNSTRHPPSKQPN